MLRWIELRHQLDDDRLPHPDRGRPHDEGYLGVHSLLRERTRDRPRDDEDDREALIVIRAFLVGAVLGLGHRQGGEGRALRRDPPRRLEAMQAI